MYNMLRFRDLLGDNNEKGIGKFMMSRFVHYTCVNTDAVYFEVGPLNQTICIAPLATPPLNFLKLVTL